MKRTTIVLVALLALVIAACSSEQAASSAADAEPSSAAETAAASEAAESDAAGEETGGGDGPDAVPSFDLNGDPELAERFPDTVGGQPLEMISMRGDTFMAGGVDPSFEELLSAVGADLEDVSVAFGGVAVGEGALSVAAFRVAGASQTTLEEQFVAATEEESAVGLSRSSVGGKEVWQASDPSGQVGGIFIYVKDDTVYYVTGSEEHAAEIFETLP